MDANSPTSGRGELEAGLSARGETRRGEILEQLYRAQRTRRRKRLAAKGAIAALPVLAIAALVATLSGTPSQPPRPPEATGHAPDPSPAAVAQNPAAPDPVAPLPPAVRIELVRTDPEAAERCLVRTEPLRPGVQIDDTELLALMAEAGRPTGIIRTRDRVILTAGPIEPRPRGPEGRIPDWTPPDHG
jgi:hypothetical protein